MPYQRLSNFVLFSELKLNRISSWHRWEILYECEPKAQEAGCTKCGLVSESIYDHREVRVKDEPIRGKRVFLKIRKRRFFCVNCQKPFTERLDMIRQKRRTTERYRASILWACQNFSDLSRVRKAYFCSDGFLYQTLYEQLERKVKEKRYPWPKTIGIDEHSFQKRRRGAIPFVSLIVDYVNKKPFELADCKTADGLEERLKHIPGRENVQNVVLDLCDPFKKFAKNLFPNARLVADKFHVLRLLHPALHRYRRELPAHRKDRKIRRLLLTAGHRLDWFDKSDLWNFLNENPPIKELWIAKEKLHAFYRIRGLDRAKWALHKLIEDISKSELPELKTLAKTLWKWAQPILNYFLNQKFGETEIRTLV
ncbi:MAG: transposase [Bacteriovoracaceae bacterium]|nr:transposase [Bacteriovoracaceae bacterium]